MFKTAVLAVEVPLVRAQHSQIGPTTRACSRPAGFFCTYHAPLPCCDCNPHARSYWFLPGSRMSFGRPLTCRNDTHDRNVLQFAWQRANGAYDKRDDGTRHRTERVRQSERVDDF